MRANQIGVAVSVSTLLVALVSAPPARGKDDVPHKLGDHPAVVVQRLQKTAGYDYASKFYPHPAWLRLYAEQPRDAADVASESKPTSVKLSAVRE